MDEHFSPLQELTFAGAVLITTSFKIVHPA